MADESEASVYFLFLDDSGEDRDAYVTLAGYGMGGGTSDRFEPEAREHLQAYGVDHLHTVDLHRLRGQFKGWDRQKAHRFARELFAVAGKSGPVGFSFSVLKERFYQQRVALGLKREGSPLAFCLKGLLNRMMRYDAVRDRLAEPGCALTIIVEDGHKNSGDLLRTFELVKSIDPVRFKELKLAGKKDFVALQLADFLAYFERRRLTISATAKNYHHEMRFYLPVIDEIKWTDRFQAWDFHDDEPTPEEIATGQAFSY
jgi:hypothetical protein